MEGKAQRGSVAIEVTKEMRENKVIKERKERRDLKERVEMKVI